MSGWPRRLAGRLLARRVTVPIAQCVHYGAFRYGRGEDHPYETYARLLADGGRARARAWFVDFVRHYRPRHFGPALGARLAAEHGLWHYPWDRTLPANRGWFDDPLEFPDIVTQYCAEGLLWFRIEQEFFWLERAFYSIRRFGYRPEKGEALQARRLQRVDGADAWLILDGNHRLSALAALGHREVEVQFVPHAAVEEKKLAAWPQVRRGVYTAADAAAVFHAYFAGNPRWRVAETPAPLLECPPGIP